jgi:hypothetical protein
MTRTHTRARARIRKLLLAGTAVAVSAASLVGLTAPPADAQDGSPSPEPPIVHDEGLDTRPRTDSTPDLATCYGGQKPWTAGLESGEPPWSSIPSASDSPDGTISRFWVYVASDRCNDINLRLTSERTGPIEAQVCFYPYEGDPFCNQGTEIAPDDSGWNVIATDVIDGTRFEVRFDDPGPYLTGAIAH